jgi:hypothetical protein
MIASVSRTAREYFGGHCDQLDRAALAFFGQLLEQLAQRVVADLAREQRAHLAQRHGLARADERGLEDALGIQGLHVVVKSSAASRRGDRARRGTRRVRREGPPRLLAPSGAVTSRWSRRGVRPGVSPPHEPFASKGNGRLYRLAPSRGKVQASPAATTSLQA